MRARSRLLAYLVKRDEIQDQIGRQIKIGVLGLVGLLVSDAG